MGIVPWLQERGWWLHRGTTETPTHLFLDGGKARVPDDMGATFLNAYANNIVRGDLPSIAEQRTPIFKMFMDLDIKVAPDDDACATKTRDTVMFVCQQASLFFKEDDACVTVLTTPHKPGEGFVKAGVHLVWTNVYVTSSTAVAFRTMLIEKLDTKFGMIFLNKWDGIVDVCVYKSNGLRMAWSLKGSEPRAYVPHAYVKEDCWTDIGEVKGANATREWVHKTSIRTYGAVATCLRDGIIVPSSGGTEDSGIEATSKSLMEYGSVLPDLDSALPPQYTGQRFTGVLKMEHCFILRSSARYCANLGRAHYSNNVYFVLTRTGISQRCYCRCETTEGRKFGTCKEYVGETFPVSAKAIESFFGKPDDSKCPDTSTECHMIIPLLPSQASKASLEIDALLRKSRPVMKTKKKAAGKRRS